MTKLWVNLKSAILKCNAIIPKAVMGEPSVVFNFAVVGWIGVLKLLSICYMLSIRLVKLLLPNQLRLCNIFQHVP